MSDDAPAVAPRRPWRRFAALFVAISLVCFVAVAIVWAAWPATVTATALFEVRQFVTSAFDHQLQSPATDQSYDILRKTQVAFIKQKYVLASALRDPGISSLAIFAGVADPEAWLQEHLDVQYPQNGEILSIQLRGRASQASDLKVVVDAVAIAYKKEVLAAERQRSQGERDLLNQNLQDLNKDIKRKYEDYIEIARNMGKPSGESNGTQQQVNLNRLNRVEGELAQLERQQLKSKIGGDEKDSKFAAARIEQLRKLHAELLKELGKLQEASVELDTLHQELVQMRQVANDMFTQLQKMDIDLSAPERIRQLGGEAVIEPHQFALR